MTEDRVRFERTSDVYEGSMGLLGTAHSRDLEARDEIVHVALEMFVRTGVPQGTSVDGCCTLAAKVLQSRGKTRRSFTKDAKEATTTTLSQQQRHQQRRQKLQRSQQLHRQVKYSSQCPTARPLLRACRPTSRRSTSSTSRYAAGGCVCVLLRYGFCVCDRRRHGRGC